MPLRSTVRGVAVASIVMTLAGCGITATKEQADFACINFSVAISNGHGLIDPVSFTHEQLQKKYELSAPDAAEVLRQSVRDYCPQFERRL